MQRRASLTQHIVMDEQAQHQNQLIVHIARPVANPRRCSPPGIVSCKSNKQESGGNKGKEKEEDFFFFGTESGSLGWKIVSIVDDPKSARVVACLCIRALLEGVKTPASFSHNGERIVVGSPSVFSPRFFCLFPSLPPISVVMIFGDPGSPLLGTCEREDKEQ